MNIAPGTQGARWRKDSRLLAQAGEGVQSAKAAAGQNPPYPYALAARVNEFNGRHPPYPRALAARVNEFNGYPARHKKTTAPATLRGG